MFLDRPPLVIEARLFTRMPDTFRRAGVRSTWADANRPGQMVDCFIEGPSFAADGSLLVVDIPFGRIFRISTEGVWSLVAEYDGWPNGLKIARDGRIFITDYRKGLVELDAARGAISSVLATRNSESFKGLNDLHIAAHGDIYFTDQGQTGLHDPTGRVYRLRPSGQLDCLISTGVSPNGIVLDADARVMFVAMTRDNAIWRAPLLPDGSVAKVGRFCSMFGTGGPDGITMDRTGRLYVAHVSLGCVFVFAPNGVCVARIASCAGHACTNVAFSGDDQSLLYITESDTGSVMVADLTALHAQI